MSRKLSRPGSGKFWRRALPSVIVNYVFSARLHSPPTAQAGVSDSYQTIFPADPLEHGSHMEAVHLTPEALQQRVEQGDLLGVILYENKVVHRSLLKRRGRAELMGYTRGFPLSQSHAFIHSCETAKEHRGRALYPHMLTCILQWAHTNKYAEVWICCVKENRASARGILKAGFKFYGTATVVGALWQRLAWVRWNTDPASLAEE